PQTLKREIKEELAINIQVQQAGYLTSIKHAYTHFRITLHAYQAVYESGDIQHIGIADHAWVTFADLDHYAFAVTDRKIISALQKLFG
ncbi:MAG: NUDIX domain-containing protein, partial [Anaerolineales bacterium]|nr:NUDIX domain-containing protein [Anaerolineales bacterium]